MKRFYSNGKLLITGEYLVLDGAKALAVPLKLGQHMEVAEQSHGETISWSSFENRTLWFESKIDKNDFKIVSASNSEKAGYIQKLLIAARNLNPEFLSESSSVKVTNELTFNRQWGLGSSSTLISNVANWAKVDPFELNEKISNGSGYDIACASRNKPIIYAKVGRERTIKEVEFNPPFAENLFLVWLGNKKNTEQSVGWYNENRNLEVSAINEISKIGEELVTTTDMDMFLTLLNNHNKLMEQTLKVTSVHQLYFKDFPGVVKPLGAWGGDFVLAVSPEEGSEIKPYFTRKGLSTIFRWNELVLSNSKYPES